MSRLRKSIRIPPSSDAQVRHSCRICWSRRKSASQWGSTTVMTTGSLSSHPKVRRRRRCRWTIGKKRGGREMCEGEERFFHQRRPSGWIHSNGLSLVARRGSNLPMLHGEKSSTTDRL
ncbi:unnamed protein product [Amoebophrya sp. A25]|nr:unnamed protein product [Amoebophrya sp. A25]|eukprot:GSA25T00014782001.1